MDSIYHEKQEGSLCGQHCLNNLLQEKLYTPVDLAEIAQAMDTAELRQMAEVGEDTEEYRNFLKQPSGNMDDSGMFSIQVLTAAMDVWGLHLIPFQSSNVLAVSARENPNGQNAYICNFSEHWFAVRKLGSQWFNLNSLLTHAELISDTYLALFLKQLQHEGYSIFVVEGKLPSCKADQALSLIKASQSTPPKLISEVENGPRLLERSSTQEDENSDLQAAIEMSLQQSSGHSSTAQKQTTDPGTTENMETDLERAIRLSLEN